LVRFFTTGAGAGETRHGGGAIQNTRRMRMKRIALYGCLLALGNGISLCPAQELRDTRAQERVVREVRHELVMLPYYNVFDDLSFKVDGGTVTLLGSVTRPVLKSDAENVVKRIEGVDRVVDQIEVLPLSPIDDRIRLAVYRAIFSAPGLDRYAMQAVPPIHIIVKNGNVTLVGVVANKADKDRAGLQANGVSGVFKVSNDLMVEK
jgi:hyperosmotically inducible protein